MNKYKVYTHRTPDDKYYVGVTGQNPERRWRKGKAYTKNKELLEYIDKYGWDSIEHVIVKENLTKDEAKQLEDEMIMKYKELGKSLNIVRSGNIEKNNKNSYNRELYKNNDKMREHCRLCSRIWKENNKDRVKEYGIKYNQEHRDEKKIYNEAYRKSHRDKPEYKIYNRVNAYNQHHKENIIETAIEARNKYIEFGYIPEYIKNDDLKVAIAV